MKMLGIVLVIIGVIGLTLGGLSWKDRDKVADLGPVEITHTETKRIPLPPLAGGLCLAAGVVLIVAGGRTRV